MPFTAILRKGPASNKAGGSHATGPVTEGVGSGAGAGSGGAGAGSAGAAAGSTDAAAGFPIAGPPGAACAASCWAAPSCSVATSRGSLISFFISSACFVIELFVDAELTFPSCPRLELTSNKLANNTTAPARERLLIWIYSLSPLVTQRVTPSTSAVSTLNLPRCAAAVQRILLLLWIEFSF